MIRDSWGLAVGLAVGGDVAVRPGDGDASRGDRQAVGDADGGEQRRKKTWQVAFRPAS